MTAARDAASVSDDEVMRSFVKLVNDKHHSSATLYYAWKEVERRNLLVGAAFDQACTNLATIRPSGDGSLGEDALAWRDALLAGKASPW